jgi:hypothetical protein
MSPRGVTDDSILQEIHSLLDQAVRFFLFFVCF